MQNTVEEMKILQESIKRSGIYCKIMKFIYYLSFQMIFFIKIESKVLWKNKKFQSAIFKKYECVLSMNFNSYLCEDFFHETVA